MLNIGLPSNGRVTVGSVAPGDREERNAADEDYETSRCVSRQAPRGRGPRWPCLCSSCDDRGRRRRRDARRHAGSIGSRSLLVDPGKLPRPGRVLFLGVVPEREHVSCRGLQHLHQPSAPPSLTSLTPPWPTESDPRRLATAPDGTEDRACMGKTLVKSLP